MIYALVRFYANAAQAAKAVAKLQACGLSREENQINLVSPDPASSIDAIVAAITAGLVLKSDALKYAPVVARGLSLVSVNAPFGTGRRYAEILDDLGPVDAGLPQAQDEPAWDDAAPFSSMFGWRTIARPSPYLFMGMPAVARPGNTTCSWLGIGELASSSLSIFGTPALSHNPAPFSGLFRIPLIKT